ncbi:uncharacterized protein Z518_05272 [Rhinocladiella mackenziei CBS 650.93]|uniref:Rhinocladiella mackenziei CBS 650.93 unplaced genomic scaffold supercont1.4, whole genome shotgun sequence n=1 Tax=Rhinocladiella mackenziei CBS 650.93 TaxID=1442369 RepID=A0A0D2IF12_9EURO|nr:uncharacterized protein Z518_05272 [Rhinocladiella mackenziei CBS 650.93]KIX04404.1 hypothetical protein Z518_05272 [Rhinocladiella mackenziei CBS 650.93]
MSSTTISPDDPLVSALPPATDYMTYLTLLEYQLTPQNLPTLNRLLSEDEGKLAEEIGWDLLKLLLPMMSDCPDEANQCLEIVARRGNPREVVVRVAEELEKLGDEVEDDDDDFSQGDGEDALPTFAGEAPRVHLGNMTLEGMPEVTQPSGSSPVQKDDDLGSSKRSPPLRSLKLRALLDMLGLLHPRIKTQFPSRFLATSLPAALGAYRQVSISAATTSSFLTMLERLAGKQRPPLPPRISSGQTVTSSSGPAQNGATSTALLPDPEAKAEEQETGVKEPSEEEKAIIFRLLAAVILEVLDEYLSSLSSREHPCMSWTSRLREQLQPQRIWPGRPAETQLWEETGELKERTALLARFHKLSEALHLDAGMEIKKLLHDEDEPEEPEEEEEEASEYPTSPSQIPFPRAGVIFLHAYEAYLQRTDYSPRLSTTELTKLIAHSFPLSATPSIPSPALQDSLLSLLYRHTLSNQPTESQPSPAKFLLLLSTLTQLFTITPWTHLRDSAHHISTKLLHAYPDTEVRLRVISQTLDGSTLSTNWAEIEDEPDPEPGIDEETGLARSTSALQPHPIPLAPPQQLGALKAVGVDWLKDECAAWIRANAPDKEARAPGESQGLNPSILTPTVHSEVQREDNGIDTSSLLDLLFPKDLPTLLPGTATTPSASIPASHSDPGLDEPDTMSSFLLDIPYFISTLNLLCVVLPHLPHGSSSSSIGLTTRISSHINSLTSSSKFLLSILQHTTSSSPKDRDVGDDGDAVLAESRADIFALEDACMRATAALERRKDTTS